MTTKRVLQIASLVVALGALVVWLATGANRGWTKTTRQVKTLDEVTGIEGITYEKKFSPGIDFLFGAWLGGFLLASTALLFRNKPQPTPESPTP